MGSAQLPTHGRAPDRLVSIVELTRLLQTDSHGWLEGHLKEQNYGADWGDFATFAKRFKQTARNRDVDLLIIDTGML